MFSAHKYIQDQVGNYFFSEFLYLHSAPGGLGQTINVTFENQNVQLCYITFLQIDSLIQPVPPFSFFNNTNILMLQLVGVTGSITNNLFYITQGERLNIDSNNANVGFAVMFQKVFSSEQKVFKQR